MSGPANIKDLIQNLANEGGSSSPIPAKVLSVDMVARTCDVQPVDGSADIYDVRLQVSEGNDAGVLIVPLVGSFVLIVFASETLAFVACGEQHEKILIDCDEVTYNGGDLGGLFIAPKTIAELVKTVARIEAIVAALTTFASTQSAAAGPAPLTPLAAGFATLTSAISALPTGGAYSEVNLIDDKIKH